MRTLQESLGLVFVLGILLARANGGGAATLPLSNIFTNTGGTTGTNLWQYAADNHPTYYTCTQSNDSKYFRGVFTPASSNAKLAIHSDDASTVAINGQTVLNKANPETSLLDMASSFDFLNYSFSNGVEYCVEVTYQNGEHTAGDQDGVTLYAYDGGGSARSGPKITGADAVCVGNTLSLVADCGASPYTWSSGNTPVATVSGGGVVTGIKSGSTVITVTDAENFNATKTIYVVKPGISPSNVVTSVGVTNTFVLTNSAGSGTVTWNPQGTLSPNTRTNKIAFASPGTTSMTASYAGCSANATITAVAVASLTADAGDLCGGGQVIYTAQSNPAGYESALTWSGEGLSGTGAKRTNVYSTTGPHVVSISSGTSVKSITNTVYKIDIAQTTQTALADSTPALIYFLTNSYGAATWQLSGGGPSFAGPNTGNSVSINPGSAAGTFILTAYATALPSCTDTAMVQVVKVAFGATSISLCQGGSAPLPVTVTPTNYLPQLTFDTVTNLAAGLVNTHASISGTGTNLAVNGSAAGTAFVRVRLGNYTLFGPTLKIVRVQFPTNSWYAPEGGSAAYGTTVVPPEHAAEVTYASANQSVASISGSGTNLWVTGITNGTTQVLARVGNQTCVQKTIEVVAVRTMPSELDLCVGQSTFFTVSILPPTAPVVFAVASTNVASITRNGNTMTVTSLAPGVTMVTASLGGTLLGFSPLHNVRITFATNELYVAEHNSNTLAAAPIPFPVARHVTFRSANTNVATVSGAPPLLTVFGLTNGVTQIEAWIGTNQLCATKAVSVVRPGIQSVEWLNIDHTPLTNSNPNAGGGFRIYPDSLVPGGPAQNQVRIRAKLTFAVPTVNLLYLQAYDVDDPSSNTAPVDDETRGSDNRGTLNQLSLTPVPTDANGFGEAVFTVSMQPGDNFRVVSGTNAASFTGIAARQNDGVNAGVTNAGGNPVPANQVTPLLTVWRRLHVEVDSMQAVPAGSNSVLTLINSILGSQTTLATQVVVGLNLAVNDTSPNLDAGTTNANGRFENGDVLVGTNSPPARTYGILGNGSTFFRANTNQSFNIPFVLTKSGNSATGQVWKLDNSSPDNALIGVSTTLVPNAFSEGTITVAGQAFQVLANSANTVILTNSGATLACLAVDDDDNSVLPANVNTSDVEPRFAQVYITPVFDGGGNVSNNETNVPFVASTESSNVYRSQSRQANSDSFWVAYLLAGFQDSYQAFSQDFDPNLEGGTWASANNSPVGYGVIFYQESMRDGGGASLATEWRARVTVHEIGHNFGPLDRYVDPTQDGIMHGVVPTPGGAGTNYYFIDADANTIRARQRPL